MPYCNRTEETLAEKVGHWLDRAMESAQKFGNATDPVTRMSELAAALHALNAASSQCISEFVWLGGPLRGLDHDTTTPDGL